MHASRLLVLLSFTVGALSACGGPAPTSAGPESSTAPQVGGPAAPGSTGAAVVADVPVPTRSVQYSPYPDKVFPDRVYFGDTHLHTSYSTDAGMVGATVGPEEAYRFARGETVKSNHGSPVRLQRALDFLVIADHAENLGLAPMIAESAPALLANPWGKQVHDLVKAGKGPDAFNLWIAAMGALKDPFKGQGEQLARPAWQRLTAAAEKYNAPGLFTAIIGYEWTSGPNGNNLHRNVLFRDGKARADTIIPLSYYDTGDPEDLWSWMETYEKKTGGKLLAIAHNGNLSNGLMFDDVTLTTRKPLDRAYAERRMRWEPVYETTQPKGDGETHPFLSPTDEFANYERWDKGSFGPELKTTDMLRREYTREALKRGLAYEQTLGANPFKFGIIGSTDMHTGLATPAEDNFYGKVAMLEPSADPIRFDEVIIGRVPAGRARKDQHLARETSASGLAAVWSRGNTREAIWDAFARKEVYATTGTRLLVRVFGGFGFTAADLDRSDFAEQGYARGVPMGGDLKAAPAGKRPGFLIRALRDVDGANLDRVQVVKGWVDDAGKTQERVFDVVWSGNRKPGTGGKLPPVGNTVNVADASYTNSIGAPALQAFWQDPTFDPSQRAFYYVRVIEIPTPRWTTYDARFFKKALPTDVPATIQDRAYTTPIWYTPH
jgi:hypothetical protein